MWTKTRNPDQGSWIRSGGWEAAGSAQDVARSKAPTHLPAGQRSRRTFIGRRLSPTWLLDANGVTLRHTSAVPIWAKPGILMKVRKPHDHEREKTSHNEDEENANYVSARRVPLRPSHLSIHEYLDRFTSHSTRKGGLRLGSCTLYELLPLDTGSSAFADDDIEDAAPSAAESCSHHL